MHQQFSQPRFFIFSNHFQNQHANNLIQKPNRLSTLYRKILILKQFSNKRTNEPTYFLNLDSHFLFQILSYCRCNMYYHPRFPNIFKHWAIPKSEINTQTYKKKWGREGWKIDWREGSEKNLVTAGYATQTEPVLDGRPVIGVPIEYTTRLYRNRETNGADGERQKRIEARVDRTIRYRPWWLSSFRVARVVSGEEGGGSPPRRRREVEIKFHVETVWLAAFREWFSICDGEAVVHPPADHFFESGGGAAERGWQRSEQRGG